VVGLGFLWWVVRGATAGVPGRRQAFVEVVIGFIDDQVKGIFHHGDRHRFIAPTALAVFVWVVLMNAMDFVPADIVATALAGLGCMKALRSYGRREYNLRPVAVGVGAVDLVCDRGKGLGGWIHELFCAPFGAKPLLWPR
jgi:F-type H+-transporting ATPase subunit a